MKKLTAFIIIFLLTKCAVSQDTAKAQNASDNFMFSKVEIEAYYPGGDKAWAKFLSQNLHYPDDAINNEIQGVVLVQFIVHSDSSISDIQAISGPKKGGLREESIRIIKASGKWVPTTQNEKAITSYHKVPITFKLSYGK